MTTIGHVSQVWRYPAKSMMGERLDVSLVGHEGLVGDRGWALRDEERGGIRGAKKIAGLMRLAATYLEEPTPKRPTPPIEITLPDGATVRSTDPDVDERLSAALDHRVTLWPLQPPTDLDHYRRGAPDSDDLLVELRHIFGRDEDEPLPDLGQFPPEVIEYESPPGTYFDAYPLLVLTTQSLASLQRLAPDSKVDVRRFRPNVLVELAGAGTGGDGDGAFPEQAWVGRTLTVGNVELRVVGGCPRCVMITRGFADLPEDRSLMRTVVREADQNLGVYATVMRGGSVGVGEPVTLAG